VTVKLLAMSPQLARISNPGHQQMNMLQLAPCFQYRCFDQQRITNVNRRTMFSKLSSTIGIQSKQTKQ